LQSQLSTLEGLKHSGITQRELCELILHVLKLVSATVSFDYDKNGEKTKATLHYENVGYIWDKDADEDSLTFSKAENVETLEKELEYNFALTSPAREALLSVIISILSKKSPLRAVSNAALYETGKDESDRIMLMLHWQPLLRMLLRTCPYLDEHKWSCPPKDSNSRQNTIQKRTVHLIRHARHYFDQGFRPNGDKAPGEQDQTARAMWNMVKDDVLNQTYTHAFYRGLVLFYLFCPTRCSSKYYMELMPVWYECWTSLDRCPEVDFLWLVNFCRARKHISSKEFDWGPIRKRLLTHTQYW
jgi:hypothetical protein